MLELERQQTSYMHCSMLYAISCLFPNSCDTVADILNLGRAFMWLGKCT